MEKVESKGSTLRSIRAARTPRERKILALPRNPSKVRVVWFTPLLSATSVRCRSYPAVEVDGLWYAAPDSDGVRVVGTKSYATETEAIDATLEAVAGELYEALLRIERWTALQRASHARRKELAATPRAALSRRRHVVKLPRWIESCDDEMLVSTADDAVGARWRAQIADGTRAASLRSLWVAAKADMAVLDDVHRPRRSRLAAAERAYRRFNTICDRARKEKTK